VKADSGCPERLPVLCTGIVLWRDVTGRDTWNTTKPTDHDHVEAVLLKQLAPGRAMSLPAFREHRAKHTLFAPRQFPGIP
jgi:hypothetical protein